MYVIVVYDTEQKNCVRLHKLLKRYLFWNQRSVFEGALTVAQLAEVRDLVERTRAKDSHVVFYIMENEKLLRKEVLGVGNGLTSNVL